MCRKIWYSALIVCFCKILFISPVKAEEQFVVEIEKGISIFVSPDSTSTILTVTSQKSNWTILHTSPNYFEVSNGEIQGYVKTKESHVLFPETVKKFEVYAASVPYYILKNGKLLEKGNIFPGVAWKRDGQTDEYHIIHVGNQLVYVPIEGTMPTSLEVNASAPRKAVIPTTLLAENHLPVFSPEGERLGTYPRSYPVAINGIDGEYAIVNFIGREAKVPFNLLYSKDLFQGAQTVSHSEMSFYTQVIHAMYPEFTELKQIGLSLEGRAIYALKIGKGKKEVLFDAALHAREHMTTNVLLEMMDSYSIHYRNNASWAGYKPREVLDKVAIWFVPMMNPDGVTLVQGGMKAVKNGELARKINGGSTNFARWKSNVRGVDLNNNFDSEWSALNVSAKKPAYHLYKGPKAFSEPESQALRDFINSRDFLSNMSYHTSGQVIYWFNWQKGSDLNRDVGLAGKVSRLTGYRVLDPMYLIGSGSSADWFIQEKKRPALTIEISPFVGDRPVPTSYWPAIWKQNHKVGMFIATEAASR
ncbi:M14 family zinc carboxypeptidase [Paenisporosarcina cavernae]|uniref:Peptidase M14 domain-containing protein n=1 Tax=Paenisporosarcina cavernae TaxID=2320858 RepID=A0A385YR92_9BACL|nr:M14 family zinc carboxypeptidase [Paenisporosarcina cavernae]AYC28920.1 hypothetical protein D3873_03185 [Paenisporosarcina cavernae]